MHEVLRVHEVLVEVRGRVALRGLGLESLVSERAKRVHWEPVRTAAALDARLKSIGDLGEDLLRGIPSPGDHDLGEDPGQGSPGAPESAQSAHAHQDHEEY